MKLDLRFISQLNKNIRERNAKRIDGKNECLQKFSSQIIFGLFSDKGQAFPLEICLIIKEMLKPSVKDTQVLMRVCKSGAFLGRQVMNTCLEQHSVHNEELEKPLLIGLM